MRWVPFTAHVKLFPARPGKRTEYVRELQRLATFIYDALDGVSSLQLATPSGGQQRTNSQFSGLTNGVAVKPQIGNSPAQAQFTGFYQVSSDNDPTYADKKVISAGTVQSGYGGSHAWDSNPTSDVADDVVALMAILDTNIAAGLPAGVEFELFRLEFANVIFGDGGFTFPR